MKMNARRGICLKGMLKFQIDCYITMIGKEMIFLCVYYYKARNEIFYLFIYLFIYPGASNLGELL